MSLSEGDKAECKEIAREIVKETLVVHINSCPHGIKMGKIWMLVVGACLGSGAGGGGIVAVLMHIMR